jgi:Phytanoyl-CoA dioxygenase (PhyH)
MSAGVEFEGCVDRVEDGWVLGWAWAPAKPNDAVDIQVLVDGVPAVRAAAALYRPDLERAGKGNGAHAFEIRLPEPLDLSLPHEVRVVHAVSGAELGGSPAATRAAARTTSDPEPVARSTSYHSRFGGLWTDLPNALDIVVGKHALGWISSAEQDLLKAWIIDGFVILPGAVPHDLIDRLDDEVERIWQSESGHRSFVEFWDNGEKTIQPAGPRFRDRRVKLLDLFAHLESARRIIFSPAIVRFLTLVFERPAMAFQSLYFRWGSQQDIHQDTAFVKVSSPLEFAASWVALEDIQPDSGELEYYVGSHRLDDYLFDGRSKWMPFRSPEYDAFIESLHVRSRERGLKRQRFLARKGDVLIWSADLAHGGTKSATDGVTRKSLVTHYCPTSCEPVYALPDRTYPRHAFNEAALYTFAPRD